MANPGNYRGPGDPAADQSRSKFGCGRSVAQLSVRVGSPAVGGTTDGDTTDGDTTGVLVASTEGSPTSLTRRERNRYR